MSGIPVERVRCSSPLDPHNVTGLCRECKFIERNERISNADEVAQ